jgi:hypothetical protein
LTARPGAQRETQTHASRITYYASRITFHTFVLWVEGEIKDERLKIKERYGI